MLNVMREIKGHWALKALLVVVALSMTLYLGSFFLDGGSDQDEGAWAARIDGSPVASREYLEFARRMDTYYRQLLGEQYEQLRPNLQLGSQALNRVVDDRIMLMEANRLGLSASPADVSRAIVTNPEFQDESGSFVGRDAYVTAVERSVRGGTTVYERQLADQIAIRKWMDLVSQPASVNEPEVERAFRQRTEKTAVDYVVVAAADQKTPDAMSAEEIRGWYDEHQEDYLRDEARRIRYVVLARQDQMDNVEISSEEIQAFYDDNRERYQQPAQRRASHILFRVEPDTTLEDRDTLRSHAEQTLRQLQGGEDFATLARAVSQDPVSGQNGGDLGWFGRGQMVPPFENAVFNTPIGEFAPVTETDFGFHIIRVDGERDAGVTPVEEVEEEIRRQLAARRSQELLLAEGDRIHGLMSSGDAFVGVAEAEGLEIVESTVTRDDRLAELGPSPEFRNTLIEMAAGTVSAPLGVARGLAIVAVDEIVPPTVAALDDVESQVRTAILNQRAHDAALDSARLALERGKTLVAAAGELGAEVQSSGDLAPGRVVLPGAGGASPELADLLFGDETAEGDNGIVVVPAGAVIYEVTRRIGFDPETFADSRDTLRDELLNRKRDELLQSVLTKVKAGYRIEINEDLVNRLNS